MRWGIVGAGRVARAFALDVARAPGNRVETIAARDPARAAVLRAGVAARRTSASYQALFEDPDVDVVYIATVNSVHHEHALRAVSAGQNVVVEKPLALNAAQGRDIARRAEAAGRFCMEGMWMRMHPLIRRARELVRTGFLGDVLGVHAELCSAHPYVPSDRLFDPGAGGGALLDLGVYSAHFAWLFLGPPDGIVATSTFAANGVDGRGGHAMDLSRRQIRAAVRELPQIRGDGRDRRRHGWIPAPRTAAQPAPPVVFPCGPGRAGHRDRELAWQRVRARDCRGISVCPRGRQGEPAGAAERLGWNPGCTGPGSRTATDRA